MQENTVNILPDNQITYCRTDQIASMFGVSSRRVQQLTQDGVLPTTEILEKGHNARRYELSSSVLAYSDYLKEKINSKVGKEKTLQLEQKKLEAEIALKESQGELHQIKTQIAQGKYIDIEIVKIDYQKFFVIFKKWAMSLPSRVAGMLPSTVLPMKVRQIESELTDDLKTQLRAFVVAGSLPEGEDETSVKKPKGKKKKCENLKPRATSEHLSKPSIRRKT